MRKLLLLLPLLFTIACEPVDNDVQYPPAGKDTTSVVAPDTFVPDFNNPDKKVPPAVRIDLEVPEAEDADFCRPGEACDIAGDAVLARMVDIRVSTFTMRPDDRGFVPGDAVSFEVCAFDAAGEPVAGLPAIVVVKATRKLFAGDGTTLTGEDGCVMVYGVFTADEEIGDRSNDEADSGSYILNAYIGGRLLQALEILHDTV